MKSEILSAALPGAATFAAAALLGACAGPSQPLPAADLAALAGQPRIQVVHYTPARHFQVKSTAGMTMAVLFSPLIAIPMALEAQQLVKDLDLRDPVGRVRDHLAASARGPLGGASIEVAHATAEDDDLPALQRAYGTRPVLDVRTMAWGIDDDRVNYEARARLLDLSSSRIVWEARCAVVADKGQPSPSRESLKADNGALLKAKLVQAADGCADELARLAFEKAP